jgi:hypothetical protein
MVGARAQALSDRMAEERMKEATARGNRTRHVKEAPPENIRQITTFGELSASPVEEPAA